MTVQKEIDKLMHQITAITKAYQKAIEQLEIVASAHCQCCGLYHGGDCDCQSALAKDALEELTE